MDKDPSSPDRWADLSRVQAILGHTAEAVASAQTACRLAPSDRDATNLGWRQNLAKVYAVTGNPDKAINELTALVRIPCGLNIFKAQHSAWFAALRGNPSFAALTHDPANNAPIDLESGAPTLVGP